MTRRTPAALGARSPNADREPDVLVVVLGAGEKEGAFGIEQVAHGAEVSTGTVILITGEQWRQWRDVEDQRAQMLAEFTAIAKQPHPRSRRT